MERATQIARARGAAVAELPRAALEREIAVAAAHSTALAEHRPSLINAPLRVIWAQATTGGAGRATDWSRYTRGGVEERVLEGAHHYSVLTPPHASAVCAQLGQWIESATASRTQAGARAG